MQIRTITAGAREADIGKAAAAALAARQRLENAGYIVQTLRLALSPSGVNACGDFKAIALGAETQALDAGFDYVSLGTVEGERLDSLAEALAATEAVFASVQIATLDGLIRRDAIQRAAQAMVALGQTTENGFGNLRLAASACVPPGSPFFPAATHDGGAPWLAIGPEAAALALEATDPAQTETPPLQRLSQLISQHDQQIRATLTPIEQQYGIRFAGCDWSLAPHPAPERSIGLAIERLSGVPFGSWGTLAAVAGLTEAIRQAIPERLGFSGVMLPVLEDATLALRNSEGRFTLRDLLAFSAVCGTGLDTIPLPGDTAPEQIAAVLLEVATLASRLRKPLTARLMPIPRLRAGDMTSFDFAYFVNTRVMPIA